MWNKVAIVSCLLCVLKSPISSSLIDESFSPSYDCVYINNNTESVHLVCDSKPIDLRQIGCAYDLFKSPSKYTNSANVKLLRIHDSKCDASLHREFISKTFRSVQELEYSYTSVTIPLKGLNFKRLQKLTVSHNYIQLMGFFIGASAHV